MRSSAEQSGAVPPQVRVLPGSLSAASPDQSSSRQAASIAGDGGASGKMLRVMHDLLAPFEGPIDVVGFVLWLLVFPVYHSLYPLLAHRRTALERFGRFRRSWVKRVIDNDNLLFAVQRPAPLVSIRWA